MTTAAAARKMAENLIALAAKATPGPWSTIAPKKAGGTLGDYGDVGIDANGVAIAEAWQHCPMRGEPDGTLVNSAANGAYIAAANPEAITTLAQAYLSLSRPQAGLTEWLEWNEDAARKAGRVLAIWVWRASDGLSICGQDSHASMTHGLFSEDLW